MNNLEDIEQAVRQLSSEELAAFRTWFAEFDAEVWDQKFEADVAAGKLDTLAEKALKHLRENESKLSALYSEFAEEDQLLAEEGISEYAEMLRRED